MPKRKPQKSKTTLAKADVSKDVSRREPDARLEITTGSRGGDAQWHLLEQVLETTLRPDGRSGDENDPNCLAALELLDGIKPIGEIEGMLAVQMVAAHAAAIECFRRAALPNQIPAVRDINLRHAEKLLGVYSRQIEVLDKRRGKGQQQIIVKYVNVESGGQAVVGNVQSGARSTKTNDGTAASTSAPTEQAETAVEIDHALTRPETRTRRKS